MGHLATCPPVVGERRTPSTYQLQRETISIVAWIAAGAIVCSAALLASLAGAPLTVPIACSALVHFALFACLPRIARRGYGLLALFLTVQTFSLVLLPIADLVAGPPRLPEAVAGSYDQMGISILTGTLFTVSFSLPWLTGAKTSAGDSKVDEAPVRLGVAALLLGFVGLGLRYSTAPLDLGLGQAWLWNSTREGAGWRDLLAGLMVPLLTPGLLILSKRWAQAHAIHWLLPAWLGVIAALLSFMLNRATMMVSLAAAVVVWHLRIKKVRPRTFVFLAGSSILSFVAIGAFRAPLLNAWDPYKSNHFFEELIRQAQVYGQSPAFLSGTSNLPNAGYNFGTFAASLIGPLPGIGTPFRDATGTAVFNQAIYGTGAEVKDFILPTWMELYLSFGMVGLIIGGALLGFAAKWCTIGLKRGRTLLNTFAAAVGLLWFSMSGIISWSVLVQSLLYQAVPSMAVSSLYQFARGSSSKL